MEDIVMRRLKRRSGNRAERDRGRREGKKGGGQRDEIEIEKEGKQEGGERGTEKVVRREKRGIEKEGRDRVLEMGGNIEGEGGGKRRNTEGEEREGGEMEE